MITPTVSAGQTSSRPSSAKSDSSKSPATSSDEGDSEYISYSDGSSEGIVLSSLVGNANIVIYSNKTNIHQSGRGKWWIFTKP